MDPESRIQTAHPGEPFPKLTLQTTDGEVRLPTDQWTLMIAFRSLRSDSCRQYVPRFQAALERFRERDVRVVAFSMETKENAHEIKEQWGLDDMEVAYGLGSGDAARLGLFISTSIEEDEPDRFTEPGLFLSRPDGTLQAMWTQSTPQARPTAEQILEAIAEVQDQDAPPRGVHETEVATRTH